MSPKKIKVVLDESGNSGLNFLDLNPTQFYVLGGFLFHREHGDIISEKFQAWETEVLMPGQVELKGSTFFKRKKSIASFQKLFMDISGHILGPTHSIIDKKFALSTLIIESFFDSAYNDSVSAESFFNEETKREWAERIYSTLSTESFTVFNTAVKEKTMETLIKAQADIVKDLTAKNERELSKIVSLVRVEDTYEFMTTGDSSTFSLNMYAFRPFIYKLKSELSNFGEIECEILHDNQKVYQASFQDFFKLVNDGEQIEFRLGKWERLIFGKGSLKSLEFSCSETSALIRLADLFCTFFQKSLMDIENKSNDLKSPEYQALLVVFWGPMMRYFHPQMGFPAWFFEALPAKTMVSIIVAVQEAVGPKDF